MRDARRRAKNVEGLAKRLVHHRSGLLGHSIHVRLRPGLKGLSFEIGSDLDYALFHHDGTGIYGPRHRPIRAKGKVMVFSVNGHRVYTPQVKGQRGTKFLERALVAAKF